MHIVHAPFTSAGNNHLCPVTGNDDGSRPSVAMTSYSQQRWFTPVCSYSQLQPTMMVHAHLQLLTVMAHAPMQLPATITCAQLQPTTMVHTPLQLPAIIAHAQLQPITMIHAPLQLQTVMAYAPLQIPAMIAHV